MHSTEEEGRCRGKGFVAARTPGILVPKTHRITVDFHLQLIDVSGHLPPASRALQNTFKVLQRLAKLPIPPRRLTRYRRPLLSLLLWSGTKAPILNPTQRKAAIAEGA